MFEGFRKLFTAEDWMPARRVLQRDAEWWNKLRNDCTVRFGFMAQKELSGQKLAIGENILYQFGSGRFIAHQLYGEGKPVCQMIVASAGGNQVYLALSRALSEREISYLLAEDEFAAMPDLGQFSKLYVREHTPGVKDWVTMQYHRRIGSIRGQKTTREGTRTFQYFLFVNETNDKALEIEWFDDGAYEMYATIYRPVSDIVQVHQDRRPAMRERAAEIEPIVRPEPRLAAVSADLPPMVNAEAEEVASAEILELPQPRREVAFIPEPIEPVGEARHEVETSPEFYPEVEAPFVEEAAHAAMPDDGSLSCNIRVAAKIIDEALRNDMMLGDIVRRVLGLPVAASETVSFHVPLTDQDYHILAERFGVPPEDRDTIRDLIVEDLIDFTGERDSEIPRKRVGQS